LQATPSIGRRSRARGGGEIPTIPEHAGSHGDRQGKVTIGAARTRVFRAYRVAAESEVKQVRIRIWGSSQEGAKARQEGLRKAKKSRKS
jgi:hypothetical protein